MRHVLIFGAMILSCVCSAEVVQKSVRIGKLDVQYKVILPNGYNPAKAYPGVLAFGGGPQTMDVVNRTFERNWRREAVKRGYIVVSPAAPGGVLFFEGGEKIFPEFIVKILADYKILNNQFHIAGMSNGGISSFHVAAMYPQYFVSITGFPGYLPEPTPARLKAISKMCIDMYAGGDDTGWRDDMKQQSEGFRKMGMNVRFSVEKNQPHMISTLTGDGAGRLFDDFDRARVECGK